MVNVKKVYAAHTINKIASSIISVYIPAYLLSLGFPLSRVILFFIINHAIGLLFGLFLFVPLVQRWGLLNTFKLYYPLQILSFILLALVKTYHFPPELIALVNGLALFAYWIPMNIFLVKYADHKQMGSAVSKFFALPNLFGIIGPLLGALLIPIFGFWPVFVLTVVGLLVSFVPLLSLQGSEVTVSLNFKKAWSRFVRNKTLFLFEFLDNMIEESDWFWGVYVFVIIGSLSTPGIVGSLEAIGGSVFTLLVGKYANQHSRKLIPVAAFFLLVVTLFKIFTTNPFGAYALSLAGSFVLNFFLVTYFSTIYKTIKNDSEEEFLILREIPTVLGRMVVFTTVYLTLSHLQYFFILPLIIAVLLLVLYLFKRKLLVE